MIEYCHNKTNKRVTTMDGRKPITPRGVKSREVRKEYIVTILIIIRHSNRHTRPPDSTPE